MLFVIYILAISLQVSGALLLVIFSASTKRDEIIKRFVGKKLMYREGDDGKLNYDEQAYKEEFKVALLNKLSFVYIALGYLLGVWGENGKTSKVLTTILVILSTIIIMFLSIIFIDLHLIKSKNIAREITNEDLKRLNIEPTVQFASENEIDDLCNKVFGTDISELK